MRERKYVKSNILQEKEERKKITINNNVRKVVIKSLVTNWKG